MDVLAVRALLREGFPDGLALSFHAADAAAAQERLRRQIVALKEDASSLRELARDYQAIYLVPHHLDGAGRMTRRGDRFVSCLHVVRQLADDAARRNDGKSLADYLDAVFLPQLASFRLWTELRGQGGRGVGYGAGGRGFYGHLTVFSDAYFRELRRRLGNEAIETLSTLKGHRGSRVGRP
ncbi:MAG TPA: hypothetical protein VM661_09425 [Candidatus Sulfotelmatobacter sp.]|nr:hypothetical protein [Candidatus Sulfotelmatobacter sp.]